MQHQDFYHHPLSSFDESSIDELQAPTFHRAYARGDPSLSTEDDEFSCEAENVHDNLRSSLVPTYLSNHQAHHTDRFNLDSDPAQCRKHCGVEELDSL